MSDVVWAPHPGGQRAFIECPVFEVIATGGRGGGKSEVMLMDFAQHVGEGFGVAWGGLLLRRTYKQLEEVEKKSLQLFPQLFPAAKYVSQPTRRWTWPDGEFLRLSFMDKPGDYWNYHGHEYAWIGWEELTTWPDDKCYKSLMSVCRSTVKKMPRKFRATTNPGGVGLNWVKARFHLPIPAGETFGPVIRDERQPPRVAIRIPYEENVALREAEPDYQDRIRAAARSPAELRAWLYEDWDIVAGGMFDDVWQPAVHVVPDVDWKEIPPSWRLDRSYDHGQSKPFVALWWAESSGESIVVQGREVGAVRGDLILVEEWYGWTGEPNTGIRMGAGQIAAGIIAREVEWGARGRVRPGPADSQIFSDYEPGYCVAGDMEKQGVTWFRSDKGPGSRRQGWQRVRELLRRAAPGEDGTRDEPGLFICRRCEQFLRTVPTLPRSERDQYDVETESEDHIGDALRYRCWERADTLKITSW